MEFREIDTAVGRKLELFLEGRPLGDALTDNAHVTDGYRYHDVFHLGNAILLGWSPVIRKLLGVKRKSNTQIDEVEDGARAAVTEEAISAVIFGHAKDYSFFEGATSVDYELLKLIMLMTRPFEVRDRSLREWENVVLSSFTVWRQMKGNGGGVLIGDGDKQTLTYEAFS